MPRPRLQRVATAQPEKIQLPIAEQNFFSCMLQYCLLTATSPRRPARSPLCCGPEVSHLDIPVQPIAPRHGNGQVQLSELRWPAGRTRPRSLRHSIHPEHRVKGVVGAGGADGPEP
jgi:hypothetical protein